MGDEQDRNPTPSKKKARKAATVLYLTSTDVDEDSLTSKHFLVNCSLAANRHDPAVISSKALLDSGADASFIDQSIAHLFPIIPLTNPRRIRLANGEICENAITCAAQVQLRVGHHHERLVCYIADLGKREFILGVPCMERHNDSPNWQDRTISLHLEHWRHHCLHEGGGRPMLVPCANTNTAEEITLAAVSAEEFARLTHIGNDSFAILHIPTYVDEEAEHVAALQKAVEDVTGPRLTTPPLGLTAISQADIDKFMDKDRVYTDPLTVLPPQYREFANVFSRSAADQLPPHRPQDHEIQVYEGKQPPYYRSRGMSQEELAMAKKYLDEQLAKGFIRPSSRPRQLVCIDYRGLNEITVENRYPILLIRETLEKLAKAKYFNKFDNTAAFNNIRLKQVDEWKTAFNSHHGQYEYLVMPFGLCSAPGTFQSYINSTLHEYLDDFCTGYLDDILVFSETLEEHQEHVRKVLQRLRDAQFYADIDKSKFEVTSAKYLGLIISTEGLKMDPNKIDAVLEWPTPRVLKDVQGFIGFANFYRRYIERFSLLAKPLTDLTRNKGRFEMTDPAALAFDELKHRFTEAPILAHFDFEKQVVLRLTLPTTSRLLYCLSGMTIRNTAAPFDQWLTCPKR